MSDYPHFRGSPHRLRIEIRDDNFYGRPCPQRRQGLDSQIINRKLQSLNDESINFHSGRSLFGWDWGSAKLNVACFTLAFRVIFKNPTFQKQILNPVLKTKTISKGNFLLMTRDCLRLTPRSSPLYNPPHKKTVLIHCTATGWGFCVSKASR